MYWKANKSFETFTRRSIVKGLLWELLVKYIIWLTWNVDCQLWQYQLLSRMVWSQQTTLMTDNWWQSVEITTCPWHNQTIQILSELQRWLAMSKFLFQTHYNYSFALNQSSLKSIHFWQFYFSVSYLVFASTAKIYQLLETVFHCNKSR